MSVDTAESNADIVRILRTKESVRLFRVVQLERWDLTRDDLAKDAVGVGLGGHLEQSACGGECENVGRWKLQKLSLKSMPFGLLIGRSVVVVARRKACMSFVTSSMVQAGQRVRASTKAVE